MTLGQEFVRGAAGTWDVSDFPRRGDTATFMWNESTQHLELSGFNGNGHQTHHVIEGFDVYVSPTVFTDPNYRPELLQWDLDIIKAQLLWIASYNSVPHSALLHLEDSGVSFYLDVSSDWSDGWPCSREHRGSACYNIEKNQIGIAVLGEEWEGMSWLRFDHTRQSVVLHELAHAFHAQVIAGGFDNVCIREQYEAVKARYRAVETLEQSSGLGPIHLRRPPGHIPREQHWAYLNEFEYFAEASEAMWYQNNSYPWNRNELWHHDQNGYRLIYDAWHDPKGFCPEQAAPPCSMDAGIDC